MGQCGEKRGEDGVKGIRRLYLLGEKWQMSGQLLKVELPIFADGLVVELRERGATRMIPIFLALVTLSLKLPFTEMGKIQEKQV